LLHERALPAGVPSVLKSWMPMRVLKNASNAATSCFRRGTTR